MTTLTPTMIRSLCETYHLSPSKAYGQHYLISSAPIEKMIGAAALSSDDMVVEVGPGFGVLTLAVAPLVKRVVAFEIEKKIQPYWEEKMKEFPNIEVQWGNVLNEFNAYSHKFGEKYKVVANLPYQITSQAIRLFLEAEHPPECMIVMLQKEVAERICAKPGDMSLLAVSVQYYGVPSIVTKVPKGAFWPAPKVDSAVVKIVSTKEKGRTARDTDIFFQIVRAGFAHKRKQLWRNVSEGLHLPADSVKAAVLAATDNEKVRAEALSIDQWHQLSSALGNSL